MDNHKLNELNMENLSIDEILSDDFLKDLNLHEQDDQINVEIESAEEPATDQSTTMLYSDSQERLIERSRRTRSRIRPQNKEQKLPWQKAVLLYMHDLVYFLAAIVLVFLLCFRVVVVSGTSMNSTLYDGDYLLLISDFFYRNPHPGDIIVASKDSFDNGAPIVKRVIAVAGQKVDIDFTTGVVYVDGKALDEPYVNTPTNLDEGVDFPLIVDEGCLFVMGDNRNDSKDSRNPQIGLIDRREVLGKVIFLVFPGTNYGQEDADFNRIGVVS